MYELKDYLNAINYTKEKLLDSDDEQWEKKYPPFIVNKCIAPFPDTIMLVNEIRNVYWTSELVNIFYQPSSSVSFNEKVKVIN